MSATGGHRDQCGVPLGSFWKEVIWLTFASAPRRVEASSQGFSVTSTGGRSQPAAASQQPAAASQQPAASAQLAATELRDRRRWWTNNY